MEIAPVSKYQIMIVCNAHLGRVHTFKTSAVRGGRLVFIYKHMYDLHKLKSTDMSKVC